MISSSTDLMPWRASISTKARRRFWRPDRYRFSRACHFATTVQRRIGIAIARQVDEVVASAQGEKVDLLRAARRVRRARQRLAPRQRVDQSRFSDIGAPGETDLDPVGMRAGRTWRRRLSGIRSRPANSLRPRSAVISSGSSATGKGSAITEPPPDRQGDLAALDDLAIDAEILMSNRLLSAPSVSASRAPVSGLAVVARQRAIGSRSAISALPTRIACRPSRIPPRARSPSTWILPRQRSWRDPAPLSRSDVVGREC